MPNALKKKEKKETIRLESILFSNATSYVPIATHTSVTKACAVTKCMWCDTKYVRTFEIKLSLIVLS